MPNVNATSNLTAKQRLQAVAAILARGVLRYHRHIRRLDGCPGKISPVSSPEGLEVLGESRLSVSQRAAG